MKFLEEIHRHGTLRAKPRKSYKSSDPRGNFTKLARLQIDAIESGALDRKGRHRGHWFRREADGSYVIELKNGVVPLKLEGVMSEIVCKDATTAIALIAAAANAASRGEFDELFRHARPQRRGATAAKKGGPHDLAS